MDEDYQPGGAQAPEDFEKSAADQIGGLTGPNGPLPGANADGGQNAMADGVIAALASAVSPVAKIASLFVGLGDGLGGKNNNTGLSAQKPSPASQFVGGLQSHMPKSIVPMSPREMAEAAKMSAKFGVNRAARGSIFAAERLALVAQSVTGGGTADGKASPIKGAKVTEAAVQKLTKLKKSLDNARWAKTGLNRYEGEGKDKRLPADLKKNTQLANTAVKNPGIRPPTAMASGSAA